jgi:GNAT superfamily N-acetyltransferase
MHEVIASETLRTGEALRIERVVAPDADRQAQILPLLSHKPGGYRAHLEAAFADACDDLETRFYLGLRDDDTVVGNIMTVEAHGVGILGHVYTHPEHRRKGVCQAIMAHQMDDFRTRNGHVLLLGTGYQSPAYWIYHSFGFRDLPGASPGTMRYVSEDEPDFEADFFADAGGALTVVPARWKHWPLVALLASLPELPYLRSLTLEAWGVSLLEGPYCYFLARREEDERVAAAVLEAGNGAVAGVATLVPDEHWPGVARLDLFAHPRVASPILAALVRALPPAPPFSDDVQCFADPRDALKIAALEQAGFTRRAVLPGQFREGDTWRDAWLYGRRAGE